MSSITQRMKGHVICTIMSTMTVSNSRYKELIGMKFFVILALMNAGINF